MRNLVFQKIQILSKVEKAAIELNLDPNLNVITGDNDVGKSTLIKSLYHTLGADVPQLSNNRWKKANPIYCLSFELNGQRYRVVRDGTYFGLFSNSGELIGRYQGITREGGVANKISELLSFNIELESKDGSLRKLSPSFYFLPFYIDQDQGWQSVWSSFNGLQQIKQYRTKLIDYHLGIRSQDYYNAIRKRYELQSDLSEVTARKNALLAVREDYKDRKQSLQVDLDPSEFKKELDELVDAYNDVKYRSDDLLSLIKEKRNEKINIMNEINILNATISELDKDYQYAESADRSDEIDCPTCGTVFENSVVARFGILDDIDYCSDLIDQRKKKILYIDDEIDSLNEIRKKLSIEQGAIQELLNRKKFDISLADVVRSEGYKGIIQSLEEDIHNNILTEISYEKQISQLRSIERVDRERKNEIILTYQSSMKRALTSLNVDVLQEEDYNQPNKLIRTNALGSDLPRALIAQYFSYLHTMSEHNKFVLCPMVIDSPRQQEKDNKNERAIFDFIADNVIDGQQLIIGTTSVSDQKIFDESVSDKTIILDNKLSLLRAEEYDKVLDDIHSLHDMTLGGGGH